MPARVVIDPGPVEPDVVGAAAARAVAASDAIEVALVVPAGTAAGPDVERLTTLDAGAGLLPGDDPGVAVRARPDLPIRVATEALAAGRADLVVSLGPPEAVLTAARFALPRIPGVRDPLLAVPVSVDGTTTWLLDTSGRTGVAAGTLAQAASRFAPSQVGVVVLGERPTAAERDRLTVAVNAGFAAEHVPVGGWHRAHVDALLVDGGVGAAIVATLVAVAPTSLGTAHVAGLASGAIWHVPASADVSGRLERALREAAEA